jgi:hypothetical protein
MRAGDRFEFFGSFAAFGRVVPGERACLSLMNADFARQGRVCAVLDPTPPQTPAAEGERCDVEGLLRPCVAGTECSTTPDDSRLRCRAPIECQTYTPVPRLSLDLPLSTDEAGLGGFGGPCTFEDGQVGYHFEFIAPHAGRYVFDSNSAAGRFTVRRHCGLLHTIAACSYSDPFLEVDLAAGQTVTVVYTSPDVSLGAIEVIVSTL